MTERLSGDHEAQVSRTELEIVLNNPPTDEADNEHYFQLLSDMCAAYVEQHDVTTEEMACLLDELTAPAAS